MRRGSQSSGFVFAVLVAMACAAEDSADNDDYRDPYMDEPLPPVCKDSTGPCETDGEPEDLCAASADCPAGQQCRADFDGERTAFECSDVCVPTANEDGWCIDDASCCDPAAQCSPRGYCLVP
jgi:hypothetical protein